MGSLKELDTLIFLMPHFGPPLSEICLRLISENVRSCSLKSGGDNDSVQYRGQLRVLQEQACSLIVWAVHN